MTQTTYIRHRKINRRCYQYKIIIEEKYLGRCDEHQERMKTTVGGAVPVHGEARGEGI